MSGIMVRAEVLSATARAQGTEVVVTATRRVDPVEVVGGERWNIECALPERAPQSEVLTFEDGAAVITALQRIAGRVLDAWLALTEADRELTAVLRDLGAGAPT